MPELYDLCQARVQAVQAELAAATAKLQALESQKKATDTQPTVTRQNVVPNSATNVAPLVTQVSPASEFAKNLHTQSPLRFVLLYVLNPVYMP